MESDSVDESKRRLLAGAVRQPVDKLEPDSVDESKRRLRVGAGAISRRAEISH